MGTGNSRALWSFFPLPAFVQAQPDFSLKVGSILQLRFPDKAQAAPPPVFSAVSSLLNIRLSLGWGQRLESVTDKGCQRTGFVEPEVFSASGSLLAPPWPLSWPCIDAMGVSPDPQEEAAMKAVVPTNASHGICFTNDQVS